MIDPKDSRERFTAAADDYDRYRPDYSAELLDWIVATAGIQPGARVADVGCGTGISTRFLAARGFQTVGVDPNEEMLARARNHGGAEYVRGEAAATNLPDRSFALVTVAQAFHWFDVGPTMREFQRILIPDGWCAAFWNKRDQTPFLSEYDRLLETIGEYRRVPKFADAVQRIETTRNVRSLRSAEFRHVQIVDREGVFGRFASSSYVVHSEVPRQELERKLGELFDRHAVNGRVEFVYRVPARMWQLA